VQLLDPSPKLTQVFAIASSSEVVTVTVTGDPSVALAGALTLTVGARSLIVIEAAAEVVVLPAASVAFAVILNTLLATPPAL
jgi:citrate lyase alpha subunit